ncbi:MAG TPA: histidine phosphatase family protein [Actinomycetota bacterium]
MATRKPQVVLVRHGETDWSANGRHTGRTDVALTDEGRRQAKALGTCLEEWTFALVLASPLQRATETCRLAGLGGAMQICEDLREWNYGEFEGRTTADIRTGRPGWTLWVDGVPGGETAEQVGRRADRVIAEARAAPGDVALFAHGHILRVLSARWLDLPPDRGRSFALHTATISVLGFERETPVITRWNVPCG